MINNQNNTMQLHTDNFEWFDMWCAGNIFYNDNDNNNDNKGGPGILP